MIGRSGGSTGDETKREEGGKRELVEGMAGRVRACRAMQWHTSALYERLSSSSRYCRPADQATEQTASSCLRGWSCVARMTASSRALMQAMIRPDERCRGLTFLWV
jgi:hypothetical protein